MGEAEAQAAGRDRSDPGADGRAEWSGGFRARRRRRQRQAVGGASAAGSTAGEDPGSPREARAGEGGEARGPSPEELCGSRRQHGEDRRGRDAVLLQRAGGGEREWERIPVLPWRMRAIAARSIFGCWASAANAAWWRWAARASPRSGRREAGPGADHVDVVRTPQASSWIDGLTALGVAWHDPRRRAAPSAARSTLLRHEQQEPADHDRSCPGIATGLS